MEKEKTEKQVNISKVNLEPIIKLTSDVDINLIKLIEYEDKGILTSEQTKTIQQLKDETDSTNEDRL